MKKIGFLSVLSVFMTSLCVSCGPIVNVDIIERDNSQGLVFTIEDESVNSLLSDPNNYFNFEGIENLLILEKGYVDRINHSNRNYVKILTTFENSSSKASFMELLENSDLNIYTIEAVIPPHETINTLQLETSKTDYSIGDSSDLFLRGEFNDYVFDTSTRSGVVYVETKRSNVSRLTNVLDNIDYISYNSSGILSVEDKIGFNVMIENKEAVRDSYYAQLSLANYLSRLNYTECVNLNYRNGCYEDGLCITVCYARTFESGVYFSDNSLVEFTKNDANNITDEFVSINGNKVNSLLGNIKFIKSGTLKITYKPTHPYDDKDIELLIQIN